MKPKRTYIIPGFIAVAALTLLTHLALRFTRTSIEGCWYYGDKQHHWVFHEGKIYMEGGAPNCLGVYEPGLLELFGRYEKRSDGYAVVFPNSTLPVRISNSTLTLDLGSTNKSLILMRETDRDFIRSIDRAFSAGISNGSLHFVSDNAPLRKGTREPWNR